MPEPRLELDRPKDIIYSDIFSAATDALPAKRQARILATLHRWLEEVRKGGYFELDGAHGEIPQKIGPGQVAIIHFTAEGSDLPEAFMSVKVGSRSWFEAFSKGCIRREFLHAINYMEI